MQHIGESSIWVEKYRPNNIQDVILPDRLRTYFEEMIKDGELQNLLFYSGAGTGKTTVAKVLARETKADVMYINAAVENSIDTIRYKVSHFAMSHSLLDTKKVIILDEVERLRGDDAQQALKVLIEEAESNARFIFCTNNIYKMIDPLQSRLQPVSFYYDAKEGEDVMAKVFKRCLFILDQEEVEYDKKAVALFVQKMAPDIRKTINRLAMFAKMHGKIDNRIMSFMDTETKIEKLIEVIKSKKFNSMIPMMSTIPADEFFLLFYEKANEMLKDECKPQVILTLGEYNKYHGLVADAALNLAACCTEIMKVAKWQ